LATLIIGILYGENGSIEAQPCQGCHIATLRRKATLMDVQTLINTLNVGGFQVLPHGAEGVAITPEVGLSDEQRRAIREHKATLRLLACIPDAYAHAEREAIQFADSDTPEADEALLQARYELQEIIEPPEACQCGSLVFRWDLAGERHCIACHPGQSARIHRIAESIRKRYADMVKSKSPECCKHSGDSNPTPFVEERM